MSGDPRCDSCRLVRRDGSEWRVEELDLESQPPRVRAVDPTAADGGDLASEPAPTTLARGDRIEWLDGNGRVVWAYRQPVTLEPRP